MSWSKPPRGVPAPPVVVLVPSFREDPRTIRQTLLSAALQDYPNRRVVLLLDDPPLPMSRSMSPCWRRRGGSGRDHGPAGGAGGPGPRRLRRLSWAGEARRVRPGAGDRCPVRRPGRGRCLAGGAGGRERPADHTDDLFVALIFDGARSLLAQTVRRLLDPGRDARQTFTDLDRDFRRLAELFQVEITTFERKRYANLSREPNKAANLNGYLGLVGRQGAGGRARRRALPRVRRAGRGGNGSVVIPDATYVLTLDADSLLSPDYARRLVGLMEAPGNERVAVAQTPYSAIPNPPGVLERIAGATTDMQYVRPPGVHLVQRDLLGRRERAAAQGGAGRDPHRRDGARLPGGEVHPGPDGDRGHGVDRRSGRPRLAAAELPGAAGVQRHTARLRLAADPAAAVGERGLLVLPKLWRYAGTRPNRWRRSLEIFVRAHYLGSICGSSIGLLPAPLPAGGGGPEQRLAAPYCPPVLPALLARPAPGRVPGRRHPAGLRLQSPAPADQSGRRGKSIQQGSPARRSRSGGRRRWRVGRPRPLGGALRVVADGLLRVRGGLGLPRGREMEALFLSSTAVMLGYALVAFVGLRASAQDIFSGLSRPRWPKRLRRHSQDSVPQAQLLPSVDPGGD